MATPTVNQLLKEINQILRNKDGAKLRNYLLIEPPLAPIYDTITKELGQSYPSRNQAQLDKHCEAALPEYDGEEVGGSWPAFNAFIVHYFGFLRDVNPQQLVETHNMLKSLLNQAILALSDSTMGAVVLPLVISYSRILSGLSINLDKRPELVTSMTSRSTFGNSEAAERVTLVETVANTIREGFRKCVTERAAAATNGLDQNGVPAGRRIGIYATANICLKLFFRCRKLRSAETIFTNIYQHSPPLSHFPASQRVTFLYYLGRYHFANNHFLRASATLQAAYNQCHRLCQRQRTQILTYLIPSNIILGRFPSQSLLSSPEAQPLAEHFFPLCTTLRAGDLTTFHNILSLSSPTGAFFLRVRVLLQLQNRLEALLLRSLARRVFLLSGFQGDESRRAPTFDLEDLHAAINFLEARVVGDAAPVAYVDPDLEGAEEVEDPGTSYEDVEAGIASLVTQGLIKGYVSHKLGKVAITGAKGSKNVALVGFPNVWSVLGRADEDVPGWVTESAVGKRGRAGGVVRLSNVKPVGVVAA